VRRRLKDGASWERHKKRTRRVDRKTGRKLPIAAVSMPNQNRSNLDWQSDWQFGLNGAASSVGITIRRISRLPTLPDGSGEGGLEMTQANQIKKSDDFKLVIVFRIEGQNSRAIILRFVGIAATLVAIGVKLALMTATRTH
jgi:hypothetical protein